jgi:hypothetical protein
MENQEQIRRIRERSSTKLPLRVLALHVKVRALAKSVFHVLKVLMGCRDNFAFSIGI